MAERDQAPGRGQRERLPKRPRMQEAPGRGADGAKEPAGSAPAGGHPVCTVALCPICMMVTTVGDLRPELVEHLLAAGREMLLAARAVIDARLQTLEEDEPASGLTRIDIE